MFEFKKTNTGNLKNNIFRCDYESAQNVNIVDFVRYLQSLGYEIKKVGICNNSDMYERTLMPEYGVDAFAANYDYIVSSPDYDRTQINVKYNDDIVMIYVKDNNIQVISYDKPVCLEDILKK